MSKFTGNSIRTQKARGVLLGIPLLRQVAPVLHDKARYFDHHLLRSPTDKVTTKFPFFARPCPVTPRHGFVESRVVKNKTDLAKLWRETLLQDENGEILLGKCFPDITSSAVLVDSGILSIGPGNDGATSGKNSFSLKVAPVDIPEEVRTASGISRDESVFVEFIRNDIDNIIVQLRGGPKIAGTMDFIPSKTVVKKIVAPDDDLILWAEKVKKFSPGTVVYAPTHTLASHAAIHCVAHNVPFITSFKPNMGDTIERTSEVQDLDISSFQDGVRTGLASIDSEIEIYELFNLSISILHNWSYIRASLRASYYIGLAGALFAKLCIALIKGECRHLADGSLSRNAIYSETVYHKISDINFLRKAIWDFVHKEWEDGFGDVPWAVCSWYTIKLWNSLANCFESDIDPNSAINCVVENLNSVVNMSHNGGWFFNKIAADGDMDSAVNFPGWTIAMSFDALHKLTQQQKRLHFNPNAFNESKLPVIKSKEGPILAGIRIMPYSYDYDEDYLEQVKRIFNSSRIEISLLNDEGLTFKRKAIPLPKEIRTKLKAKASQLAQSNREILFFPFVDNKVYLCGASVPLPKNMVNK